MSFPPAGQPGESASHAPRDGGKNWKWQPITSDLKVDNLRPIVPAGHPGKTFVLWYRGRYETYTKFETEVVAYGGE